MKNLALYLCLLCVISACSTPEPINAQSADTTVDMTVEEYEPTSTLVVPENLVSRAKFPFVDVHSHWFRAPTMRAGAIDTLISEMDGMNMAVIVNLSGGNGDNLKGAISNMESKYPNRIVTFANVDFDSVGAEGWTEKAVAQLRADVAAGARGLKVYKNLGMDVKDVEGNRVSVDDPRLDPIWALAGELGIPVLIHSADPANFWQPMDKFNEKWLELKLNPNRLRVEGVDAPFDTIMNEHYTMIGNHPETTFISAHLSWLGNDLGKLGSLLDKYPNMYSEVGAVIYEIGRQPAMALEFFTKYKDRILFGKDTYRVSEFDTYFRVFETADEYFPYYRKYHAQWRMYGADLPDDILKAVYYENALRIIPGLDASLFTK